MRSAAMFANGRWLILAILMLSSAIGRANLMPETIIRSADSGTGVTWVMVRLTNQGGSPQGGKLTFASYSNSGGSDIIIPVAKIPPGASRILNIPLLFPTQTASLTGDDGRSRSINLETYNRYGGMDSRGYALVSEPQNQLTDTQLDDFTRANNPGTFTLGSGATMHYPGSMSSSSFATTAPLLAAERNISQMEVSEMPENWLCYVPLKILFLPQSLENQVSAAQREALDTWTELGGNLYIIDADTSDTQARGLGTVRRLTNNPVRDAENLSQVPKPINQLISGVAGGIMPYASKDMGGRGFLLGLITLFVIAAGPVNYIYYARRGQIRKILKTLPLVSLAFCGLIGIYFLVTEGFARKGGSISVTQLDEKTNRAVTFAQHVLVSGLYPSGGFHFDRLAYLRSLTGTDNEQVTAVLDREMTITRGLFRPKIAFRYMTILPHSTRERLLVNEDSRSARNGFALPLKAVSVYRNGKYSAGGGAPSGGEVSLQPREPKPLPEDEMAFLDTYGGLAGDPRNNVIINLVRQLDAAGISASETDFLVNQVRALKPVSEDTSGTIYAAVFQGLPPGIQPGVEIKDGQNLHVIVGTVDETETTE